MIGNLFVWAPLVALVLYVLASALADAQRRQDEREGR